MPDSIISSVGGKYWLRSTLNSYLCQHKCYCEVFGGAGHLLLYKEPSYVEIYNDISKDLYAFFRTLQLNAEKFAEKADLLPYSRDFFNEFKAMKPINDFDRALRFYYLNRTAFGGKRASKATFGYSPTMPMAVHKLHRYEEVMLFVRRIRDIVIENLDFKVIIDKYDTEDTLFYCDSPYWSVESHYDEWYAFGNQDHLDLHTILTKIKGKFLVSYNDCPEIRELYKDYQIREVSGFEAVKNTKGGERLERKELTITNYDLTMVEMPLFKMPENEGEQDGLCI